MPLNVGAMARHTRMRVWRLVQEQILRMMESVTPKPKFMMMCAYTVMES